MNSNISASTNQMFRDINNSLFQTGLLNKMGGINTATNNINNSLNNGVQSIADKIAEQRVSMEKLLSSQKQANQIWRNSELVKPKNTHKMYPYCKINEV